jgi:hypothetical protein
MADKITITASPKAADLLFKAVEKVVKEHSHTEEIDDFANQNPAASRLITEYKQAFVVMLNSLAKQVEKIFAEETETTTESKIY